MLIVRRIVRRTLRVAQVLAKSQLVDRTIQRRLMVTISNIDNLVNGLQSSYAYSAADFEVEN